MIHKFLDIISENEKIKLKVFVNVKIFKLTSVVDISQAIRVLYSQFATGEQVKLTLLY